MSEKTKATSSPTVTRSPSPTPTLSPTPEPTVKPTVKPTIEPTPTSVPVPKYTSQQVSEFIERFAGQYGVDPNVLRAIAICETSFNPEAINGPYYGLYQFAPISWQNLRIQMGENPDTNFRLDAEEAAQTAAYAISKGKRGMWPTCNP